MTISNMTLVKIGAIGGVLTVSMGMALRHKLNSNVKQTEYYKDALKTLRTSKSVVHLLGEPIKDGFVEVADSANNFTTNDTAQYQVPIRGPKDKGTMFFWAHKNGENWIVNRIELGLKSEPNKRLLVKDINRSK